jgi:hypothetical protein
VENLVLATKVPLHDVKVSVWSAKYMKLGMSVEEL